MPIYKFTIEYDNDEPLLQVHHFRYNVYPKHEESNLKTLKGVLELVIDSLMLTPICDNTIIPRLHQNGTEPPLSFMLYLFLFLLVIWYLLALPTFIV